MSERASSGITRLRLCVAASAVIAVASVLGCNNKSDDDNQSTPTPPVAPPSTTPIGQGAPPAAPPPGSTSNQSGNSAGSASGSAEGTYFADVTANGTGCPAGTWEKEISGDKRSFTLTFSAYDAKVDESSTVSVKDCILGLKIKSRKPVAYAVAQFSIEGYGQLDTGVSAKLMAAYYFQGNPAENTKDRVNLPGPYDKEYAFTQSVALPEQVWSQCGLERDLNVVTRVRVMNGTPPKKGHVNVAQAKGKPKLFVQLSEKPCL
jgi:hypothetical protein